MKLFFLFIIFSILIIIWFVFYIYRLFIIYKNNNDLIYQDTLKEIKKPEIFNQVKNGNNVSRITISGFVDIKNLQNEVNEKQKLVDQINEKIKKQDLDNELERIKRESIILKEENDDLNNQLSSLVREFDSIVNETNSFTELSRGLRSDRSNNKDLLHYMYNGIKDPFNIIFKNE